MVTRSSAPGTVYWPVSGNHARPVFPFGHSGSDDHGAGGGGEDAGPEPLMRADPRVDMQPVASGPACEFSIGVSGYRLLSVGLTGAITRCSPALPARVRSAVRVWPASPLPCRSALTAAAMMHQRVGWDRFLVTGHCADQCPVVPVGQGADGAVPADRDSPASGDDLVLVEEQHVKLGEVALDPAEVFSGDRVVEDEFRPARAKCVPGLPIKVMTVSCRDDL